MTRVVVSTVLAILSGGGAVALSSWIWRRRMDRSRGATLGWIVGVLFLVLVVACALSVAVSAPVLAEVAMLGFFPALGLVGLVAIGLEISEWRERRALRAAAVAAGSEISRKDFRRRPLQPMVVIVLWIFGGGLVWAAYAVVLIVVGVRPGDWGTFTLPPGGGAELDTALFAPMVVISVAGALHMLVNMFRTS